MVGRSGIGESGIGESGTDPPGELARPVPAQRWADRAGAWLNWFGVGRLVAAAVATVIVCAGAYWLVRTPPPPTEAALPRATQPPDAVGSDPLVEAATSTAAASPGILVVHVAGAVQRPGVVTLAGGARVLDAVDAAGGAAPDADLDALNLAGLVVDGSRVYVPVVGEVPPPEPGGFGGTSDGAPSSPSSPVDVNRAAAGELDLLPGVGPATAAAIVDERERNGPFVGVDDLERVPGIGPAKLAALRDLVTT